MSVLQKGMYIACRSHCFLSFVCVGGGGGGRLAKMRKLNIEMRKCRSKVNGYTFRGSNFFYFPVGLPSH